MSVSSKGTSQIRCLAASLNDGGFVPDTPPIVQFADWPTDIWGEILATLEDPAQDYCWHQPPPPAAFKVSEQVLMCKQYFDLRLVCRKFNQALASETDLLNHFCYYQTDASLFMPKLLAYLKANRTINYLSCASDAPCLGMLLPQLLVSPGELESLRINVVTAATVSCLSAYTGLVSCSLYASSGESLNLQPIAALHNLEHLCLHGAQFHGLQLGDHLQFFFIGFATVTCEPGSSILLPGLRNFAAVQAEITLPGIGLTACTALTRLEMQMSKIASAEDCNHWNDIRQTLPESMSTMLSLTNLTVHVESATVCLEQFGVLPALTRLHLMHESVSSLAGDVAVLDRLRKLVISSPFHDSVSDMRYCTAPSFDFDWEKLQGLKAVQIRGAATFDCSILQVIELPRLLQFQLLSFAPGDTVTAQYVAALPELFAKRRPEIDVVIKEIYD